MPLNIIKLTLPVLLILFTIITPASSIACDSTLDPDTQACPLLHECINNQCIHKDIFPLTTREIVGSIVLMILAGLANAGGLGGGALLTPVLLIFFQYSANKAIMLVYSIVFGGSFGNFLNVAFKRNPKTNRPLVDYDLSIICMPLMTLGAMIGILINKVFAPILMIVGLIIVMIYSGQKLYVKAKDQYTKETNERAQAILEHLSPHNSFHDIELVEIMSDKQKSQEIKLQGNQELEEILKQEQKLFPTKKIGILLTLLLFIILTTLLRGSRDFGSLIGLDYCRSEYWLVYLFAIMGCGAIYTKASALVTHEAQVKSECNYQEQHNEFTMTPTVINKMMPLSLIAGVLAGLLGLGGGMIMSPALLQLGMEPQILAATVGFFVVQTSFITLFQSLMYGDVSGTELMFFFVIAFVGSYGVSWFMKYLVEREKRPSLMLLTLCFVIFVSLVVMPVFSVYKSIDRPEEMFTFGSIC